MKLPTQKRGRRYREPPKLGLSFSHPRGRHKACVFAETLRLIADDVEELRTLLLGAALASDATPETPVATDDYAQPYVIEFAVCRPAPETSIRRNWIVCRGEDFPNLTNY